MYNSSTCIINLQNKKFDNFKKSRVFKPPKNYPFKRVKKKTNKKKLVSFKDKKFDNFQKSCFYKNSLVFKTI